jgi:phosphoglycolate phosphatase-like HAD superfamily hydrolase
MLKSLVNKGLLITETVDFVKKHHKNYNMHIVSGSDGKELNQICKGIEIDQYFKSIQGSPTPKISLVTDLIEKHNYNTQSTILVGDSINDYEAAVENGIFFKAYNNESLSCKSNIEFDLRNEN